MNANSATKFDFWGGAVRRVQVHILIIKIDAHTIAKYRETIGVNDVFPCHFVPYLERNWRIVRTTTHPLHTELKMRKVGFRAWSEISSVVPCLHTGRKMCWRPGQSNKCYKARIRGRCWTNQQASNHTLSRSSYLRLFHTLRFPTT